MQILLPEELADFVRQQIATGRYASPSDVVREALRMMERDGPRKLASLRETWAKGAASGDAGPLDMTAIKQEARARREARS